MQANDCIYTQAALSVRLPRSMFMFDLEDALGLFCRSIAHCSGYPHNTAIMSSLPITLFVISRPPWWGVNVRHHATTLLLAMHGHYCLQCWAQGITERVKKKESYFYFLRPILLGFVAIDTLGRFPNTHSRSRNSFVITDCYSKLLKVKPTARITATTTSKISKEHLVANFRISSTALMDNGFWFT